MAKFNAKSARANLTEAGIDWDKLKTFNWVQLFNLIQSILGLFKTRPQAIESVADDAAECCTACVEHFNCIIAVADCGKECCSHHAA